MLRALAFLALALLPHTTKATFSIAACTPDGTCGVAVATHNLAVGATVPTARAGVGALAVQFETNLTYATRALHHLEQGETPQATLDALLATDNDPDGGTAADRQLGIVRPDGASATYTGANALRATWAGARHGHGYAIQGNGLAGPAVLDAMRTTFTEQRGPLAARLLAALEAGHRAGGQSIGAMSAAFLVRTPEGGWQDIDLRVDGATSPIADLRRLHDQRSAFDLLLRAEREARAGNTAAARITRDAALAQSHGWDRLHRRAARLSMTLGDHDAAIATLRSFHAANRAWARSELADPLYDPIRSDPRLQALDD